MKDAKAKAKRRVRDEDVAPDSDSSSTSSDGSPRRKKASSGRKSSRKDSKKKKTSRKAKKSSRKFPKSKFDAIVAGLTDSESSESEAGGLPLKRSKQSSSKKKRVFDKKGKPSKSDPDSSNRGRERNAAEHRGVRHEVLPAVKGGRFLKHRRGCRSWQPLSED